MIVIEIEYIWNWKYDFDRPIIQELIWFYDLICLFKRIINSVETFATFVTPFRDESLSKLAPFKNATKFYVSIFE